MQASIYDLLKSNKTVSMVQSGLSERVIKSIIYQSLLGLHYIHTNGVYHRDLKPENILYTMPSQEAYSETTSQGVLPIIKLADFGLSKEFTPHKKEQNKRDTEYVATRWYRAPELLLRFPYYDYKVDIFALGCIIIELFTGVPMASGVNEYDQIQKLYKILGSPPEHWREGINQAQKLGINIHDYQPPYLQQMVPNLSNEVLDLIFKMLKWDAKMRPTARECLEHPYFKNYS